MLCSRNNVLCDYCGSEMKRSEGVHYVQDDSPEHGNCWTYCSELCFETDYADGRLENMRLNDETNPISTLQAWCERSIAAQLTEFLKTLPRQVVRRATFKRLAMTCLEID